MAEPLRCTYDELPYESQFFTMTHPDRMAVMATLHGLDPPDVAGCRVLELGCSNGGNLLPMAQTLPGARFVGIDLSPRQVADGLEIVAELGFANVDLRAMSILDIDDDLGTFDYIICHGVYSWVPEPVRHKILDVCDRHLAPNGVAYVSYNTYPGWHLRGMVREMLLCHTEGFDDPATRVRQARAFLDYLIHATPDPDGAYGQVLRREAHLLEDESDTYLFHEHLEEENQPVYFRDFVARAEAAGLQYLAPARFSARDLALNPAARRVLDQLEGDRVRREQYLDFVLNRTFRQTLLCHAGLPLGTPRPEALERLRISAQARPVSDEPDVRSPAPERFVAITREDATTDRPLMKAALVGLFERWPRSASLDEVLDDVRSRLGDGGVDRRDLAAGLLHAHKANLVALHVHEPAFTTEPGARPVGSRLARFLTEGDTRVISLRLRNVELDEFDALVLRLLDGTRDRAAVLAALEDLAASGVLQLERDNRPVHDRAELRALLAGALEPSLRRLAAEALLVA
jgi:methyltransferase-like protein